MTTEWISRDPIRRSSVIVSAEAQVPTRHGSFKMMVFRHNSEPDKEHVAMVRGTLARERVLSRVHSECMTSEVFGSLKCDCAEQLDQALTRIAEEGSGVLLYLRQEGRGIGLANKIRAYALQAGGVDTVDANRVLGLGDDLRCYDAAAEMLGLLGVRSVRLMTNNPQKVEQLERAGVIVEARVPSVIPPNPHSAGYLVAKRTRMNHLLPV